MCYIDRSEKKACALETGIPYLFELLFLVPSFTKTGNVEL
jgi:hypothetical protein